MTTEQVQDVYWKHKHIQRIVVTIHFKQHVRRHKQEVRLKNNRRKYITLEKEYSLLPFPEPLNKGVHIENEINMNSERWDNMELALRLETDVVNDQHHFCTDMNGFQVDLIVETVLKTSSGLKTLYVHIKIKCLCNGFYLFPHCSSMKLLLFIEKRVELRENKQNRKKNNNEKQTNKNTQKKTQK